MKKGAFTFPPDGSSRQGPHHAEPEESTVGRRHVDRPATQSFARSPLGKVKLPNLLRALNDPEPINRVFATFAVERVSGKRLDPAQVDITAPPAHRAHQIDALLREMVKPLSSDK